MTTITHDEYMAARKTMAHAMQYLRASYTCWDDNTVSALILAVNATETAYNVWREYR